MPQPILFKNSLSIALVTLLQTTMSAVVAIASLFAFVQAWELQVAEQAVPLAFITLVLCLVLIRWPDDFHEQITPQTRRAILRICFQWLVMLGIVVLTARILNFPIEPRDMFVAWALTTPVLLIALILIANRLTQRIIMNAANNRSVVFAGFNDLSLELSCRVQKSLTLRMRVCGFFDDRSAERLGMNDGAQLIGKLTELGTYVRANNVDVIFITLPIRHVKRVMDLLDDLRDSTVSIYYVPDIFVFDLIQARFAEIQGIPVVAMCETPFYGYRGIVKRLMDIVISGLALLMLSPVLLLAMLAVKLTSAGPAIFKQRRYGLDGREILVYKFRSMTVTEDGQQVQQATKKDKRITKVGAFLRKSSIDELPQLINVLQGKMSLVGPRPHAVAHNEMYRKLIKGYMVRHKVLPGITGLAQVSGCRGETSKLEDMEKRVNFDLEYLRHWTPLLDIKIMFLTALKVFRDDQAY